MAKTAGKSAEPEKKNNPFPAPSIPFLFKKKDYMILLGGIGLLAVGFLLMMGGNQPADQWDPNVIYGFRVTTLSTIVVMLGFLVVLYSIFRKGH